MAIGIDRKDWIDRTNSMHVIRVITEVWWQSWKCLLPLLPTGVSEQARDLLRQNWRSRPSAA